MSNVYDVGDLVRVSALFKDDAGAAIDPTAVTLKYKSPDGTVSTLTYANEEVTRTAAGAYQADITIDQSGKWAFRWEGTGAAQAAREASFQVRQSAFE